MRLRWLLALATLPLPVTVLVPAGLVWLFRSGRWGHSLPAPASPWFWLGALAGAVGLALSAWAALSFARFGEGTPAPWDPPKSFVPRGPYRHVRNPMILGVSLVLLAEAVMLRSWPLLAWFALFAGANALYIPFVEERGLLRRFGDMYAEYRRQVPRWLPQMGARRPG